MATLAIMGGRPVRARPWPAWPIHGDAEERNLREVLDSGNWWMGAKTRAFEERFAAFQDARHGIACANGTLAIEAALLAADIGFADEVLTTPYTFVATTSAILRVNALPVYADVDELSGNLDPEEAERCITPRTRAIVPVHVAGLPVDLDRFEALGRKHAVPVIYDAAHAWGTQWRGRGVGAYGALNTCSFQASKNITAGEGGMILSNDDALAARARSYVNCGRSPGGRWYEHVVIGANLRLSEFQSAVLLAQLDRLAEQVERRARNAEALERLLGELPGIRVPVKDERVTRRSYHLFQFCFEPDAWSGLTRERFLAALNAEGVPALAVWPLMNRLKLFRQERPPRAWPALTMVPPGRRQDYPALELPRAARLSGETGIWLRQNMLLGEESDMRDIAAAVAKIRENLDALLKADA